MSLPAALRHHDMMHLALEEAALAAAQGEIPVGCVIVQNNEVIARGHNEVEQTGDPTRHAEMVAVERAVQRLGTKFLDDCTLYVTLEPCTMCAGAMVLARVATIVYGADEPKTGAVRSLFEVADDPRLNHRCLVRSGVQAEEAKNLLTTFFAERRSATSVVQERVDPKPTGRLVLVPTPIGNLEDITKRALDTLRDADVILCEDTRRTGQLLRHYGLGSKRMVSYHEHNERDRAAEIVERVRQGLTVALVSDAGMPGISDPGFRAVQACSQEGLPVMALPGASAAITAAAASGLPTDELYFVGFPPQKKGRKTFLERVLDATATIVMYESPHRLERLLDEIVSIGGGDREVVVARELSKTYEEYLRGTAASVAATVAARGGIKGECVVLVAGRMP